MAWKLRLALQTDFILLIGRTGIIGFWVCKGVYEGLYGFIIGFRA